MYMAHNYAINEQIVGVHTCAKTMATIKCHTSFNCITLHVAEQMATTSGHKRYENQIDGQDS